ncbi:MAG: hypothetical protein L6R28_22990 [Planctomycetes bacterium]|nr:hypothetical protein [Planctomycetota bacterium]
MKTCRLAAIALLFACGITASVRAEGKSEEPKPEAKAADAEQKAAELLKKLADDDFGTREQAEKDLIALGAPAYPIVKQAVEKTDDAEVRTRGKRVLETVALDAENDPNALAAQARTLALEKKYERAAKYYEKAGRRFRENAAETKDNAVRDDLTAKAAKATQRQARATKLAGKGNAADDNGDEEVVFAGGAGVRVRVIAGGGMIVEDAEVGEAGDSGDDW